MRERHSKILCASIYLLAVLVVSFTANAQIDAPVIVEGHVFNKWTHVPLENAAVQIISEQGASGPQDNFVARTDEHGFYSFELKPGFALRDLWVSCGSRETGIVFAFINVPHPGLQYSRRDAFLEMRRKRSFRECIDISVPF